MMKIPALLALASIMLSGCDSKPERIYQTPERHFTSPQSQTRADAEFAVYDPAQGVNKQIYKFNAELDRYFLLPVVDTYIYITPKFFRTGVANFFSNIGEVTNFTNAVFQINPEKAGITLGRFAVNSTAGLLGTFDVATGWGLIRQPEDFGKTLGHWGSGAGAYVVLPVFGPSNVRDTAGKIVDFSLFSLIIPSHIEDTAAYDIINYGLGPIDARYVNDFRYYSSGSPFEYELVRYISTQLREAQIEKEKHPQALSAK